MKGFDNALCDSGDAAPQDVCDGWLDTYVFNVGQADSQLIVFSSRDCILVDAGETSTDSMNCKAIAERVISIFGKPYVDVGVVTHLHANHVGYAGNNGFYHLMEKAGISFGKLVDRNSGVPKTPWGSAASSRTSTGASSGRRARRRSGGSATR